MSSKQRSPIHVCSLSLSNLKEVKGKLDEINTQFESMDDLEKQKNETIKYKRNGLLWVELSMEYNRHVQLQYVLEHLGDKGSNPKLRRIKMSPVFAWWKREMLRQRWREINQVLHYNDVTKKIEAKYSDFAKERAEGASKQMNSLQTIQNPPIKDLVSLEALSDLNSFVIPHVAITSNLSGFVDADYCQSTIVDEITGVSESEIPPAFRSKDGKKSKNDNKDGNDDSYEYDSSGNRIEGNNSKKGSKNGSKNSKNKGSHDGAKDGSNYDGKSQDNSDGNNNSNFGGGIFGIFRGANNSNNSKENGPENSDKNGKSQNQRSSRGKGRNGSGKNNETNGNDTNDDYYDDYYSVDPNISKDGNKSPRRHHRSGRNNDEPLKDANGNPISPRNKSRRSNNSNNNGIEENEEGIQGNGVHSRRNGSKGHSSSKGNEFSTDSYTYDEIRDENGNIISRDIGNYKKDSKGERSSRNRQRSQKSSNGFNPKLIIIGLVVVVCAIVAAYFLFGKSSANHLKVDEDTCVDMTPTPSPSPVNTPTPTPTPKKRWF